MTPTQYHDLLEAFPQPGCALCRLIQRDMYRYIDSLLYEYIARGQIMPEIRAGLGLCPPHSQQLLQYKGRALGIAIIFDWVVDEVLKIDSRTQPGAAAGFGRLFGKTSNTLADALRPQGPCLACAYLDGLEERYALAFVETLTDARFMQAFTQSDGLCLGHVRSVLQQARTPQQTETFMAVQRPKWESLRAELREFIRKYDINNAGEVMGDEGDSWQRAIRDLMGAGDVFGLRR